MNLVSILWWQLVAKCALGAPLRASTALSQSSEPSLTTPNPVLAPSSVLASATASLLQIGPPKSQTSTSSHTFPVVPSSALLSGTASSSLHSITSPASEPKRVSLSHAPTPFPTLLNSTNVTILNHDLAPSWVSSPGTRGTSDILYSCIVTLSLCVYTAIHLNIPARDEGKRAHYLRKAKWATIGVLAPEVVLFTAWQQWWSARRLCRELNQLAIDYRAKSRDRGVANHQALGGRQEQSRKNAVTGENPLDGHHEEFSLRYGFYAIMGGFVVNISKIHDKHRYLTLTPNGILHLAKRGTFASIDERLIKDKSKADMLAKGLVIAQVTWLLVQCIGRACASYPLCLLELHTFVHALCALGMYCLWFKKPLDVYDPTAVDVSGSWDLTALMLMFLSVESRQPFDVPTGEANVWASSEKDLLTFEMERNVENEETRPLIMRATALLNEESPDYEQENSSWTDTEASEEVFEMMELADDIASSSSIGNTAREHQDTPPFQQLDARIESHEQDQSDEHQPELNGSELLRIEELNSNVLVDSDREQATRYNEDADVAGRRQRSHSISSLRASVTELSADPAEYHMLPFVRTQKQITEDHAAFNLAIDEADTDMPTAEQQTHEMLGGLPVGPALITEEEDHQQMSAVLDELHSAAPYGGPAQNDAEQRRSRGNAQAGTSTHVAHHTNATKSNHNGGQIERRHGNRLFPMIGRKLSAFGNTIGHYVLEVGLGPAVVPQRKTASVRRRVDPFDGSLNFNDFSDRGYDDRSSLARYPSVGSLIRSAKYRNDDPNSGFFAFSVARIKAGPVAGMSWENTAKLTVNSREQLPNGFGLRQVYLHRSKMSKVIYSTERILPYVDELGSPCQFTLRASIKDLRRWTYAATLIHSTWSAEQDEVISEWQQKLKALIADVEKAKQDLENPIAVQRRGYLVSRLEERRERLAAEIDNTTTLNFLDSFIFDRYKNCLCRRSKNFDVQGRTTFDVFNLTKYRFGIMLPFVLILATSCYGLIHASAWRFAFPTPLEQLLWRASCIHLSSFFVAALPVWAWKMLLSSASNPHRLTRDCSFIPVLLMALDSPLYVASRVYLVLESFISLRKVPVGVYKEVPWSNYIPHI